ncbi:MAG: glycosyltransferase family 4 protein [Saprospiraceae bacterium]
MKKLLIIAYYWPPSGGAGVQRWLKLSKYLCEQGADVHVLTVDEKYASYTQTDKSLIHDIHPKVKVHKTKSFEPINIYARMVGKENVPTAGFANVDSSSFKQKIVTSIRSNFFIPDPRKGWKKYALKKAVEIIQKENIKTVITTSPPHSVQLIGLALKKKLGINWIADFRDPWTDIYYYQLLRHTAYSKYFDARYEKMVLENADKIITVSQGCKDSFLSKTKKIPTEKIHLIANGFDHEDFQNLTESKPNNTFTITYTGTISDQYEPQIFFDALHDLANQHSNSTLKFQLIGSLSPNIKSYINNLAFDFEFISTVPHNEINQYQKDANLLFLAIPNVSFAKGILTGKLFEYLGTKNQIIAIGPEDSDAAAVLKQCNSGEIFNRKNKQPIFEYLEKSFSLFLEKKLKTVNNHEIQKYTRKYQANQVMDLIE